MKNKAKNVEGKKKKKKTVLNSMYIALMFSKCCCKFGLFVINLLLAYIKKCGKNSLINIWEREIERERERETSIKPKN